MIPRLDLIGIITADLARSLAFYRKLGLDIPEQDPASPHVEVTLPGGLRLAWDSVATIVSFDPEFTPGTGRPPVALAFRLDSPADVDAAYDRIIADFPGHLPPWDAFWGQRYAVILDPDGNTVDLYADLEPASPE